VAARREHPLERLRRDFDTLFDRMWSGWLAPSDQDRGSERLWDLDVTENDREVVVRAEVPGFEENELNVQLNNNVLTIRAEKEKKGDEQEEYRRYYESITLPPGINADKAQATYRNGVLEVHVPRAEGAQPKRIQVQGQQAATGPQGQQALSNQAGAAAPQAGKQGQQAGNQAGKAAAETAKK
jgi:HSP20 family protein